MKNSSDEFPGPSQNQTVPKRIISKQFVNEEQEYRVQKAQEGTAILGSMNKTEKLRWR